MTSSGAPASAKPSVSFDALSPRERQRLRLLALRYRVRRDTTLRPLADVMFDLRLVHGVQLSMSQVMELVSGTASRRRVSIERGTREERSERGGEQMSAASRRRVSTVDGASAAMSGASAEASSE